VGLTAADAAVGNPKRKTDVRIYTWGSVLDFAGIVSELLHYYWVCVSTNTPEIGASFEKEGAQIGLVCKIDLICCRSGNFLR